MSMTKPETPSASGFRVAADAVTFGKAPPGGGARDAFADYPEFVREFESTLPVHAQFVLHGNIRDHFIVRGDKPSLLHLKGLLWRVLRAHGYTCLVVFDQVDGISLHPPADQERAEERKAVERLLPAFGKKVPPLPELYEHIAAVAREQRLRLGFVVDYASRLTRDPGDPTAAERDFFLACRKLSETVAPKPGPEHRPVPLYNPVVWLVDNDRDLPAWLTAGNVRIRTIAVPFPDLGDREVAAAVLTGRRTGEPAAAPEAGAAAASFAAESEGLPLVAMAEVVRLARDRGTGLAGLPEAVRTYKLGVLKNPWRHGYLRRQISERQHELYEQVIGQDRAVSGALDVLKRAVLGLTGAQANRAVDRPRGTLFFAGPTGVGKTELAKAIAKLLFGDESAYLRFDMSEFSAEHSADRLVGAPPGYVGHEAGGELTNAIRQRPFRVVLFDEIEKAHGRLLDKFLQILEDGRLTDAQGRTTYFSETILIFTSNLGIQRWDAKTETSTVVVTPDRPYEEVERVVRAGVEEHFTHTLTRPELLNRLGGNILVFDFIRPESARLIFEKALGNVLRLVAGELGLTLTLAESAHRDLLAWCTADLAHGGRGIGNQLETLFINPLARALFDEDPEPGRSLTVTRVHREPVRLELR